MDGRKILHKTTEHNSALPLLILAEENAFFEGGFRIDEISMILIAADISEEATFLSLFFLCRMATGNAGENRLLKLSNDYSEIWSCIFPSG